MSQRIDPRWGSYRSLNELLSARAREGEEGGFTFLADGSLAGERHRLSFADLDRQARAIGAELARAGASGERALLLFAPGLDFVSALFGCLYAGVIAVPAYPPGSKRKLPRLAAVAQDASPRFVLTTAALQAKLGALSARLPLLAEATWLATDTLAGGDGEPANWEPVDWQPSDVEPETLAFLQYTSGSTARPKGVMVSHGNLLHNEEMIRRAFDLDRSSRVVGWLPLYHDMGLIGNLLQPLYLGAPGVLMSPISFLQAPRRWLEAIDHFRATTSGGPNFAYELCVDRIGLEERAGLDLSSWTLAFNGAEPVRASTLQRFAEAFAPCGFRPRAFYPCYGLAEATLLVSGGQAADLPAVRWLDPERLAAGSAAPATGEGAEAGRALVGCGTAWANQRLVIVNPETSRLRPDGKVGEIWVSGPSVTGGYWRRDEESQATFGARLALDGEAESELAELSFLRTGDLGFLTEGELFVTGRAKDLIIVRGRNLYPQDLELSAEQSHPALRAGCGAAFAGEPRKGAERRTDEAPTGEQVVVVQEIDRRREGEAGEAAAAIRAAIVAEHDVQPSRVVVTRAGGVPKTSSGKVQRGRCRSQLGAGALVVLAEDVLEAGGRSEPVLGWEGGVEALRPLPPPERREALRALLAQEVASAAKIELRRVVPEAPLAALGLDSLAAVELQHALSGGLGVEPAIADLLGGATLETLLEVVEGRLAAVEGTIGPRAEAGTSSSARPPRPTAEPAEGDHPVSPGQRALWLLARLAPENPAYNLVAAARLVAAELDVGALERACHQLADRHPVLRASFPELGGEPVMRVAAESGLEVERLPAAVEGGAGLAAAAAFAFRPFQVDNGNLLRVGLQELPDGAARLVLAVHHLVCDFWSLALMFRDLGHLYTSQLSGSAESTEEEEGALSTLDPIEVRYSDWVRRRRAARGEPGVEDSREQARAYWRRTLEAVPALDLPIDRSRPPLPTYRGGRATGRLAAPVARRLHAAAAGAGVTPNAVLLAAFQAQLARYAGQELFAVGTPTAGRDHGELREVVGYFVNPLPAVADLRAEAGGSPLTVAGLVARTARAAVAMLTHSGLALQELVEGLSGATRERGRDASRAPIFQVMFVYQRPHLPGAASLAASALGATGFPLDLGGLELATEALPERGSPFDLMLSAGSLPAAGGEGAEIGLALQFSTDLFERPTAERMIGHFQTMVTALVENLAAAGSLPIVDLPLLSTAERDQLLGAWARPATVPVPATTLPGLIAAAARRRPDHPAVVSLDGNLTYRQLALRSHQLAHALRARGIGPEARVAVVLERTPELIVALVAILEAGGVYVPIDPAYPVERQALILDDSRAAVILTQESLASTLAPELAPRLLLLDGEAERLATLPGSAPAFPLVDEPGRLAYLIYTSGSTGRPKGVAIEHRSAVAMIAWARTVFDDADLAGVLAATSICFDLSVFEIFLPLASGGTLVLASDALALAGPRAEELTALTPLTLINTVPSAIAVLVEAAAIPPSVRTVNLAGEPLKGELVRRIYAMAPNVARVLNLYGPSEDTTYSTWYSSGGEEERGRLEAGGEPTIGVPIANSRGYVLDRALRPLPIGVPGLLYLGGAGLARGYFDRPALTAERWLPDPFAGEASGSVAGDRVYATGDLARWLPDGQLEFLGRADHQVKIRGFRIELGEVEVALAAHPRIREVVVTAPADHRGELRLVAYWAPEERAEVAAEVDAAALRRHLGERLPEFMVPALFVELAALPQTPNGKIDRRALPAPEESEVGATLAPRTPTEEALAAVWSEVLGVERVGVHDHFFDLGGHSLLASRVASRIEAELGVKLALADLFASPTVESLAARVEEALLAGADSSDLESMLAALEVELA